MIDFTAPSSRRKRPSAEPVNDGSTASRRLKVPQPVLRAIKRQAKKVKRPSKPYSAFELYPHGSGKWARKIRGSIYYFGNWARRVNGKLVRVECDGWEAALEEYERQAADLHAGRTPRVTSADGISVADCCDRFLTAKLRKLQAREITQKSFAEYKETTDRIVAAFGKSFAHSSPDTVSTSTSIVLVLATR